MSNVLQPTLESSSDSKLSKFRLNVIVKLCNINEIMFQSLSPFNFKSMNIKKAVIFCPIFLLLFDFMIAVLLLKLKKKKEKKRESSNCLLCCDSQNFGSSEETNCNKSSSWFFFNVLKSLFKAIRRQLTDKISKFLLNWISQWKNKSLSLNWVK